ncbi:MAG: hypothetical protein J6S67_25115 [Methanobrevibacter sp.]|nr:hypothetical protein [Methanobrevibacter sp.]
MNTDQGVEVKILDIGYRAAKNLDFCGWPTEYDKNSRNAYVHITLDQLNNFLSGLRTKKVCDIRIKLL